LFGSGLTRKRKRGGALPPDTWSKLPPGSKENWDKPLKMDKGWSGFSDVLTNLETWPEYQEQARKEGRTATEDQYRLYRLEKYVPWKIQAEKNKEEYSGIGGFFKGAWESFRDVAPQALTDVAHVIGSVLPGASVVTNNIEGALNPEGKKHSWEELGGPVESVINKAVGATGKLVAGGRVRRHRLGPKRTLNSISMKRHC
jgi:hypothetical protein